MDQDGVFPSMMPKGVEHNLLPLSLGKLADVFPSMMPKGVEHAVSTLIRLLRGRVFPSMMPKGVEHLTSEQALSVGMIGVSFHDAERR